MNLKPLDGSGLNSLSGAPKKAEDKTVDAAKQFESLLIAQLLKSMRQSGSEGWLGTGDDKSGESAMDLAEEHFAKSLSASGGLGIASMVARGLTSSSSVHPAQPGQSSGDTKQR